MYGLVLIAVLAVMGGVIAYIGDKLGSKVGKRKLSIFGLRPKHTSILVTIVTGVIIAAATLGVLSSASNDVRTALFGMEELKGKLLSLSEEVNVKTRELDENRLKLEAKTKEYSELNAKIEETVAKLAKVSSELESVTAERDRTVAALERIQADYDTAVNDLNGAKHEIVSLQTTKNELDARVASLNEAKNGLQGDVDKLNKIVGQMQKHFSDVRQGVIIYQAGEVLSIATVKSLTPEENARSIGIFINETNKGILSRLGVAEKNLEVLWIAQADFDRAVAQLNVAEEEQVIRISAQGNTIYGEPVFGRIEMFPNRLIYTAGSTVCSQTYESGNSVQAREIVASFLQTVNSEAVKHGVIPDPLTGQVGAIDISLLSDTFNKVKRYGGRVEITAVTKKDIYSVGPLHIEINVRSLP